MPAGRVLWRGRNFWLHLTTASAQCFPLSGRLFHYECILSTTSALMFITFYYVRQHKSRVWYFLRNVYVYPSVKIYLYACLSICRSVELNVKVLLESHPEHRPSLHVYHQFSPVPNYTALLQRQWTAWRFLYTAAPWPRVDSMSTWTQVWRPTCYTTTLRLSSVCLS